MIALASRRRGGARRRSAWERFDAWATTMAGFVWSGVNLEGVVTAITAAESAMATGCAPSVTAEVAALARIEITRNVFNIKLLPFVRDHARTPSRRVSQRAFDHHGGTQISRWTANFQWRLWKALGEKILSRACRRDVRQTNSIDPRSVVVAVRKFLRSDLGGWCKIT